MTSRSSVVDPLLQVTSTDGHTFTLQSVEEVDYYLGARDKYLSENSFTHASDFRGIDRLLLMEVQMLRYQKQLASGVDYLGDPIDLADETAFRRSIKETAPQISALQVELGLTKSQRDKEQHDSVGAYIVQLKQAAKQHGVRREKQLGKALELMNELIGLAGAFQRANENERRKLGFESADDIVDWILEVAKPSYDEIDEHFRKTQQQFFIRKL